MRVTARAGPIRDEASARAGRRHSAVGLATAGAAVLATAAAAPAIFWEPLHTDENVTLLVAPRSFGAIVDRVFVERGGAPLHFFVEHLTLQWPGGLVGLRGPSLVFLLAALPGVALFVTELCGRFAAAVAVVLTAVSPLAVELATFARMYTLFLAAAVWASWAALRAARTPNVAAWAAAGAGAGAVVYVHPLAPLYSSLAVAGAVIWSTLRLRRRALAAAAAGAAYVLVQLPYLLHGFDVNRDRYEVETGGDPLVTTIGRTPAEQIVHALTPGETAGVIVSVVLALVGVAALAARRPRAAGILVLWLAVPLAFFSLVSAEETRFYDRYVLPQLPAVAAAVASGCAALARFRGRLGAVAAVTAAVALAAAALVDDVRRMDALHELELPRLVDDVRAFEDDGVLFASTGRTTYTREPPLVARTVALEIDGLRYRPERSCAQVRRFAARSARPRVGLWVFRGRPYRIALARERLAPAASVVPRTVSPELLLVRSARAERPRRLVELGNLTRRAWLVPEIGDSGTRLLIKMTRRAVDALDRGVPCNEVPAEPAVPYGRPLIPPAAG